MTKVSAPDRRLALLLMFTALIVLGSYLLRPAPGTLARPALFDTLFGPTEPPIPDTLAPAEQVAFWSARLKPGTRDYLTLTTLAGAYLAQARETGDAAAYARAEESLRRALALNPRYEPANALLGSVLIGQHAFTEALSLSLIHI